MNDYFDRFKDVEYKEIGILLAEKPNQKPVFVNRLSYNDKKVYLDNKLMFEVPVKAKYNPLGPCHRINVCGTYIDREYFDDATRIYAGTGDCAMGNIYTFGLKQNKDTSENEIYLKRISSVDVFVKDILPVVLEDEELFEGYPSEHLLVCGRSMYSQGLRMIKCSDNVITDIISNKEYKKLEPFPTGFVPSFMIDNDQNKILLKMVFDDNCIRSENLVDLGSYLKKHAISLEKTLEYCKNYYLIKRVD